MINQSWDQIETIFNTALNLAEEERSLYLLHSCSGDALLIAEVESLISAYEQDPHFMNEPAFGLALSVIGEKTSKDLSNSTIDFYQVYEKLGSGGMGEVYRAKDTKLGRIVALKFLSGSFHDDKWARKQFLKEAQASAMLDHRYICAVHGIEQSGGHDFIVMQYIDGCTLAESLRQIQNDIHQIQSIALQIIEAVAFAHSHGVIHRDLKPGNIMLTKEGRIKVLDFGLAKIVQQKNFGAGMEQTSQVSQTGIIRGTVSYMSPEQLRAEQLDHKSDIFSLGIILYELFSRENPFNHKSQAETISAILSSEPVPLRQLVPDVPQKFEAVVRKCLQKDKEKRFQSASDIQAALADPEQEVSSKAPSLRTGILRAATIFTAALLLVYLILFSYGGGRAKTTLAVLPISNESAQSENEYLASGLTRSLIEQLSNLSVLKVKPETLVSGYKGRAVDPQTAGKELNVDEVFVGSIVKRADGLVLRSKLIRTSDGFILSEGEYGLKENDLVELQQSIFSQIVSEMGSSLTDKDKDKLVKNSTVNPMALKAYFLGRFYWGRRERDDLKKAIQYFAEATNHDHYYAKAWAGLADSYALYSVPGDADVISSKEAAERAKFAAKTALQIDPDSCEPYSSLGFINMRFDWNWAEAEADFRTAIGRDPEYAPAHLGLSNVLMISGRLDEALEEAEKARVFNPFSPSSDANLSRVYYYRHDYDRMKEILSKLIEKAPENSRLSYLLGFQLLQTNKFKEATAVFEKIYQSDKLLASAPLGYVYAKTQRQAEARQILAGLDEISKTQYVSPQEKAYIYFGLGEKDKFFESLDRSCEERFPAFPYIVVDPFFDEIKSDPRFLKMRQCANL